MRPPLFRIHPDDDVAVALRDIVAGEVVALDGMHMIARSVVPKGHKIALRDISPGDLIRKYGFPIARASDEITQGEHVHSHNARTTLIASDDYAYTPTNAVPSVPARTRTFRGYSRADGKAGTRNEIWIIPTVGCVANTADRIARSAGMEELTGIDNVRALTHPFGCSQLGDDLSATRDILAALARHPNAGGVLLIGLGCESNQLDALLAAIGPVEKPIRFLTAQDAGDEIEEGLAMVRSLAREAGQVERTDLPFSALTLGVKCGGSDGFSGLTANPLVGSMTNEVTAAGGSSILTEIPEIFGAEHLLMERAANETVFDGIVRVVSSFKDYFSHHGEPVSENPSPGNIAGGITTLEEKSLGAVQKGGSARVTDVIGYGATVSKPGLTLLEAPGNDAVSSTALAAAGANIILFTTGRGTPLGFPAPTIKIASNSDLAARKPRWIDFDAEPVLEKGVEAISKDFLDLIVSVASGQLTAAEQNGECEIAIWKRGVTL